MLKLWDTRPWTAEVVAEREAVGLLNCLFAKPLCQADVLDYLRTARTISPQARQKARTLVDRYKEEADPERYYQASRAIIRQVSNGSSSSASFGFLVWWITQAQMPCRWPSEEKGATAS
jgi:hypothetical protein